MVVYGTIIARSDGREEIPMENTVFERLQLLLDQRGVVCDVLRHAPVFTSEEAARVRGTPLGSGAKALVCKVDERFVSSIPPFGSLFGLPVWCDERLGEHERINFNAGDHAISICLSYADYVAVERPHLGQFAE
jgi:Ala-tRNA(Pro) deacylase